MLGLLIPVENLIPVCVKVFQVSLADTIYTIMLSVTANKSKSLCRVAKLAIEKVERHKGTPFCLAASAQRISPRPR